MEKVVAQGEVMSPLKCTVMVDSITQSHMENLSDNLYNYKDSVPIPPLGMVDDQILVSHCGLDSALATSHINTQTNLKKLQFGAAKCHKLHVGKSGSSCPENPIDTWSLENPDNDVTSVVELSDVERGKHVIQLVEGDKYLGEVIRADGKNNLNIQEGKNRGLSAVNQICQLLDDLCLGDYYFEAANRDQRAGEGGRTSSEENILCSQQDSEGTPVSRDGKYTCQIHADGSTD